jgi:hypothetical protein
MTSSTYRALPLETLYELLEPSIRDMLVAFDTKADNMIPFNALKKQVETLLDLIEQKKKEDIRRN